MRSFYIFLGMVGWFRTRWLVEAFLSRSHGGRFFPLVPL